MLCKDVMKTNVECLSPTDNVQSAARKMREKNIGAIPVCDDKRTVIGMITDRDLALRVIADSRPSTTPLSDVMTKDIVSCRPTDDIQRAQELMGKHQKSRILCTENGRAVGVISLSDIVSRVDGAGAMQTMRQVTAREVRA
jgi:CBS domain-containing protein